MHWIGSTRSLVVHTVLFLLSFSLYFLGFNFDKILLVLTTIVSLEAIYLYIFIQMSVNKQAYDLNKVAQDVEEIQEDVDELAEDLDEEVELDKKHDEVMLSRIESTPKSL